jgi:hypothetical protein
MSFQEDKSQRKKAKEAIAKLQGSKADDEMILEDDDEDEDQLLILICIRPTYLGNPVQEDLRFIPRVGALIENEDTSLTDEKSRSISASSSGNNLSVMATREQKKRKIEEHNEVDTSSSLSSKKHV